MGVFLFFQIHQLTASESGTEDTGLFFLGKLLVSCQPPVHKLPPQSRRWQQSGVQQARLWVYSLSSFLAFGKSEDEIRFQQLV